MASSASGKTEEAYSTDRRGEGSAFASCNVDSDNISLDSDSDSDSDYDSEDDFDSYDSEDESDYDSEDDLDDQEDSEDEEEEEEEEDQDYQADVYEQEEEAAISQALGVDLSKFLKKEEFEFNLMKLAKSFEKLQEQIDHEKLRMDKEIKQKEYEFVKAVVVIDGKLK